MDWTVVVIIFQLVFLECVLSIDNAAVLGAMVAQLPDKAPIPWPKKLEKIGHFLEKPLGKQRTAALRVGLFGAYAGRALMLLVANFIIQNPWLKLVGAAYLIRLAVDDLGAPGHEGSEDDNTKPVKEMGFWSMVLSLNLMDMAFSLDNVVTAISLSDEIWVVMLGVAIGILVMRFAIGLFSYVVEKEPILKEAAYILVLNIGIEIILEELTHIEFSDWARFGISMATIFLALAYAHIPFLRFFRPLLIWLTQGLAIVNTIIDWVLAPLRGLIEMIIQIFKKPSTQGYQ